MSSPYLSPSEQLIGRFSELAKRRLLECSGLCGLSVANGAGAEEPRAGEEGPQAGTEEPQAGDDGPQAGTEEPRAGEEGPQAGTEEPQAGEEGHQAGA